MRLSWNPTANWSLQTSWADAKSPEQLEPGVNQRKVSASAIYTVPVGDHGWWSSTAAWGRRSSEGIDLNAWALESAVKHNADWTIFGRAERVENDELTMVGGHHGPVYTVGKVSLGLRSEDQGLYPPHLSCGRVCFYALELHSQCSTWSASPATTRQAPWLVRLEACQQQMAGGRLGAGRNIADLVRRVGAWPRGERQARKADQGR